MTQRYISKTGPGSQNWIATIFRQAEGENDSPEGWIDYPDETATRLTAPIVPAILTGDPRYLGYGRLSMAAPVPGPGDPTTPTQNETVTETGDEKFGSYEKIETTVITASPCLTAFQDSGDHLILEGTYSLDKYHRLLRNWDYRASEPDWDYEFEQANLVCTPLPVTCDPPAPAWERCSPVWAPVGAYAWNWDNAETYITGQVAQNAASPQFRSVWNTTSSTVDGKPVVKNSVPPPPPTDGLPYRWHWTEYKGCISGPIEQNCPTPEYDCVWVEPVGGVITPATPAETKQEWLRTTETTDCEVRIAPNIIKRWYRRLHEEKDYLGDAKTREVWEFEADYWEPIACSLDGTAAIAAHWSFVSTNPADRDTPIPVTYWLCTAEGDTELTKATAEGILLNVVTPAGGDRGEDITEIVPVDFFNKGDTRNLYRVVLPADDPLLADPTSANAKMLVDCWELPSLANTQNRSLCFDLKLGSASDPATYSFSFWR